MSQDFKVFLAASVLNDGNVVSSRFSSRLDDTGAKLFVLGILSVPRPSTQSA